MNPAIIPIPAGSYQGIERTAVRAIDPLTRNGTPSSWDSSLLFRQIDHNNTSSLIITLFSAVNWISLTSMCTSMADGGALEAAARILIAFTRHEVLIVVMKIKS